MVPPGRECSGTSRGSSAHAGSSEMGTSEVRPCRENGNYLKWVANYRYLPLYSTITMDSNNPKILAPIPSQYSLTAITADPPKFFRTFPTGRNSRNATASSRRPSENSGEVFPYRKLRTPTLWRISTFNIDFYGIWVTKTLNGERELFLAFGSAYLGRKQTLLGRGRPQNHGEIPDTMHSP